MLIANSAVIIPRHMGCSLLQFAESSRRAVALTSPDRSTAIAMTRAHNRQHCMLGARRPEHSRCAPQVDGLYLPLILLNSERGAASYGYLQARSPRGVRPFPSRRGAARLCWQLRRHPPDHDCSIGYCMGSLAHQHDRRGEGLCRCCSQSPDLARPSDYVPFQPVRVPSQ